MVIQRWQTVLLFVATVLMVIFQFIPMATVSAIGAEIKPSFFVGYMVLNIVIAVLLFLTIFLYRNMKMQRKLAVISMLMIVVSIMSGALYLYGPASPGEGIEVAWCSGVLMLVLSFVLTLWAYRRIVADQRLLSSADRIR